MNRLACQSYALAIIHFSYHALADSATVVVDDGRIGIGAITGGQFGAGSFSIGRTGSSQHTPDFINEGDGGHVILQDPAANGGHRGNGRPPQRGAGKPNKSGGNNGVHRGNSHMYPGIPQHAQGRPGQRGIGGQGGRGGGQIVIGTVVSSNNKNKNYNDKRSNSNNKQSKKSNSGDASGFPNPENEFGSFENQRGNIQIGAITGGTFGQEGNGNNKRRPAGTNVPNQGKINRKTEYPDAGNQAAFTIGHGANSNGDASAGHVDGQHNADHVYEPQSSDRDDTWIWSSY